MPEGFWRQNPVKALCARTQPLWKKSNMTRKHPTCANALGVELRQKASIFSWKVFLFVSFLLWISLLLHWHSVCAFATLFLLVFPAFSFFVSHRCFILCSLVYSHHNHPLIPHHHPPPLFLCSFCSSEVYWISADSWNAEDKEGSRSMLLLEKWYCTVDERAACVFVCVWWRVRGAMHRL